MLRRDGLDGLFVDFFVLFLQLEKKVDFIGKKVQLENDRFCIVDFFRLLDFVFCLVLSFRAAGALVVHGVIVLVHIGDGKDDSAEISQLLVELILLPLDVNFEYLVLFVQQLNLFL